MFNTIATPNSKQNPWAYCTAGGVNTDGEFSKANSNHPGGVNTLMGMGPSGSSRIRSTRPPGGPWAPTPAAGHQR